MKHYQSVFVLNLLAFLSFLGFSINGHAQLPALIPEPSFIALKEGFFPLKDVQAIYIDNGVFKGNALHLRKEILKADQGIGIETSKIQKSFSISIELEDTLGKEQYLLAISPDKITIKASHPFGCTYALQTLRQLITDSRTVPSCNIVDKPAYSIRGYMVDVGRNYLSPELIKQQIDVMAQYKLNVFHMHLTEDIAWRIQSDLYPSLRAPENMLRNKGKYYTFEELNELIQYCNERAIIFIPEIDMPGHSAAFKRATGFDMQSKEGKKILYQLLDEFMAKVQTDYIHIGGDEVEYSDKNFLIEISSYLRSKGKKTIAWDPGGQTGNEVIRQLWNGKRTPPIDKPSIDSRHLYINHFDPLEGIPAIFNHSILDTTHGDPQRLGAILCNWPDRRANNQEDVITMNAVYPSMIAFAERTWNGGGYHVYDANIGVPGSDRYEAFRSFEEKLLEHKRKYFRSLPFPYQQQSNIAWTMIGPFPNDGDITRSFAPEQKGYFDTIKQEGHRSLWGGTVWLRHFWDPVIASHLKDQNDSSTWYATRNIYADSAGYYPFWIGFNNISRSHKAPTPRAGTWDDKDSKVWVNGKEVAPPSWKFPGRIPKDLEEPLYDEGYEYREPTNIYLQKGWNRVLLKMPVKSFRSPGDAPAKWMFTFIQVSD